MKRYSLAMAVAMLLLADGARLYGQSDPQNQAPRPALSRSEEMLDRWSDIGNKLVAMAQDFPEDKYDFKLQKDERTFALNLLHAAALDFVLIRRVSGSNLGPGFGPGDNPTRAVFKTKADIVKFVQEAVVAGAKVIQQQGDAGLDSTSKFFGNRLAHNSSIWTFAIEHSGEHYGQLVVYYRANNLVPPDSRRNAQQPPQQSEQPPSTVASLVDQQISAVEKLVVNAAEAMPEEKYNFSPANLNIPGSDYNGFVPLLWRSSTSQHPTIFFGRRSLAKTPGRIEGRQRPRIRQDQGRHPKVPERFVRPGS